VFSASSLGRSSAVGDFAFGLAFDSAPLSSFVAMGALGVVAPLCDMDDGDDDDDDDGKGKEDGDGDAFVLVVEVVEFELEEVAVDDDESDAVCCVNVSVC